MQARGWFRLEELLVRQEGDWAACVHHEIDLTPARKGQSMEQVISVSHHERQVVAFDFLVRHDHVHRGWSRFVRPCTASWEGGAWP